MRTLKIMSLRSDPCDINIGPSGASQSSQPTPQTSKPSRVLGGKKLFITLSPNTDGVIGPHISKYNSEVRRIVRANMLIFYYDWRKIPKHYKDDVWNCLKVLLTHCSASLLPGVCARLRELTAHAPCPHWTPGPMEHPTQ